jgi:hypothetical protein
MTGVQFLLREYHSLQTGSGAHTAFNPGGTGTISMGLKRLGREDDTQLHLISRLKIVELYLHFSVRLYEEALKKLTKGQFYLLLLRRNAEFFGLSARK